MEFTLTERDEVVSLTFLVRREESIQDALLSLNMVAL